MKAAVVLYLKWSFLEGAVGDGEKGQRWSSKSPDLHSWPLDDMPS